MTNVLKTTFLLTALTLLFMAVGFALGGRGGMMMAFIFAIIMNFGSYWFSDKIVLKMYRAQEVTEAEAPEFYRMIERLCEKAKLPIPKVYIIPDPQPNAFATGRNPKHAAVAATEGILRLLTMDELEGVMAHELAHVKHRDILISSIAATIAGAIMMITQIAQFGMMFGGMSRNDDKGGVNPFVAILMIIVAPLAAAVVQMWISRTREYAADAGGARICGNPLALASALRKLEAGTSHIPMDANPATAHMFIVNPLKGMNFASLFSTHPATDERVARLEALAVDMGQASGLWHSPQRFSH